MSRPPDRDGDGPDDKPQFDVGYGKPPSHARWKPGRSGNPRGRPRRALGKHRQLVAAMDQPTRQMFLEEMDRTITVTSDGKKIGMPTKQMIIRSMAKTAAAGGQQAQRTAIMLQLELERELARERAEWVAAARMFKEEIGEAIERRRRLGLPEIPVVPHPDDIFIDEEAQTVEIRGPRTAEQKAALDKLLAERDGYQRGVIGHQRAAAANRRDYTLPILAAMAQQRFDVINDLLPKRYRAKLVMRMSQQQIEAAQAKYRARMAAKEKRRAARGRKPPA